MPNTTNFNWVTPADTDLVKDGAAAIRTLGNGIDTSLVDLKGGTTGQILSKNSNTDLDFTWIAASEGDITGVTAGTGISGGGTSGTVTITNSMATEITASGDIIVGTGSGTFDNLPIGTTGQVLTADTTVSPYKVKWAAPSSGAITLITRNSFSGVANTGTTFDNIFSGYSSNIVVIETMEPATTADDLQMQFLASGTVQTTDYYSASLNYIENGTTATSLTSGGNTLFTLNKAGALKANLFITSRQKVDGFGYNYNDGEFMIYNGWKAESSTLTGIRFKSASSNITGTISVYGLKVS